MQQCSKVIHLMGTVIHLTIEHDLPEPILAEAVARIRLYEKRFSANNPSSELMLVNKNAGRQAVAVHHELYKLIKIGKQHSCDKDSRLNIAIGPLVQNWRIGFKDAKVPNYVEIQRLLGKTNPEDILLDEKRQTVYLKESGMAIDLGALAKGYFADLLIDYFKDVQVRSALINLGGNLVVFGSSPNRQEGFWKIGIQDPLSPRNQFILTLKLSERSVVTSGIYERHFEKENKFYHHILDPNTGYPAETDVASLTIVSKQSLDGEIWTTRLFGKQANEILRQLEKLEEIDGVIIKQNKDILYSKGIKKYL
ncbi:FAD:protein FMN transferase [Amphibacillus sediminis]|uniref:FAD:protein FMN transferase n=1 Tax=Amphibacillus sediminis TaxID=360185 RepID=UPI000829A0BB|nr:FAD:protein FMN transferase [Amphibacillus sediminis]